MGAYAVCMRFCVLSDPRLVAINMRSDRGSAVKVNMNHDVTVTSIHCNKAALTGI